MDCYRIAPGDLKLSYSVANTSFLQQILLDSTNNYNPFVPFLIEYYHSLTTSAPGPGPGSSNQFSDETILEINYIHHIWMTDTNTRMTRYDSVYIIIQRESSLGYRIRDPVMNADQWKEKFAYNFVHVTNNTRPMRATITSPPPLPPSAPMIEPSIIKMFQSACTTVLTPVQQDDIIQSMKNYKTTQLNTSESAYEFLMKIGLNPEMVCDIMCYCECVFSYSYII